MVVEVELHPLTSYDLEVVVEPYYDLVVHFHEMVVVAEVHYD